MGGIQQFYLAATVALFIICANERSLGGCGDFGLPKDKFDGVNEFGYVSYWQQVATLNAGDLKIPLNLGFQSDRQWASKNIGGPGWWLGVADSIFLQKSDNSFEMLGPDGYTVSFGRDPKNKSVLHGAMNYKAEITGNTITVYPPCGGGWKMVYINGKLSSLIRGKYDIEIIRDENDRLKEIRNGSTVVLRTEVDRSTNLLSALIVNGRKFILEYEQKPNVQNIAGNNVVAGTAFALNKIVHPDGATTTYEFAVDGTLRPMLTITDASHKRRIIWDAASKYIAVDSPNKDTEYSYEIVPTENQGANAHIKRSDQTGTTEEWLYDPGKGFELLVDSNQNRKETKWFTSGVLAGKLRSQSVRSRDGKIVNELTRSYSETGELIRQVVKFDKGKTTEEFYHPDGSMVRVATDSTSAITSVFNKGGDILFQKTSKSPAKNNAN